MRSAAAAAAAAAVVAGAFMVVTVRLEARLAGAMARAEAAAVLTVFIRMVRCPGVQAVCPGRILLWSSMLCGCHWLTNAQAIFQKQICSNLHCN